MEILPGNWKNNNINVNDVPLKSLAHLGDAVYELYVRRKVLLQSLNSINDVHNITTGLVNSKFHADLLEFMSPHFTEAEADLLRRGRNLSLTKSKRRDHMNHRLSTSLELLIGYLYITDENRLQQLFKLMDPYIEQNF